MAIYPNVPLAPGVPLLPRDPLAVAAAVTLLVGDAVAVFAGSLVPTWGIFFNGVPVVEADNVTSMEFKQDWSLSNYPVEQGAFQSYDKVNLPFETRLRFTTGGSLADRTLFLRSIEAIAGTLTLYDVLTPEEIYTSVNVMRYDYDRKAFKGLGLFAVDIWLMQIRVTATTQFQNVSSPQSSSPQSVGQVQSVTPTQQQAAAVSMIF